MKRLLIAALALAACAAWPQSIPYYTGGLEPGQIPFGVNGTCLVSQGTGLSTPPVFASCAGGSPTITYNVTPVASFTTGDILTAGASNIGHITPAAGIATFLATPSSAHLAAALTDETGTGSAMFATAPTLSSPTINTAATFGFITGSTQCLHVSTLGVLSGTGSDCGSGGGGTITYNTTPVSGFTTGGFLTAG